MAALPRGRSSIFGPSFSMDSLLVATFILLAVCPSFSKTKEGTTDTYHTLFKAGVDAYMRSEWVKCATFMKKALADYRIYRDAVIDCRLTCSSSNPLSSTGASSESSFLEAVLKRSDCLRRCHAETFRDRPARNNTSVDSIFQDLKPYDYLQICAYKSGQYDTAASAAYTFHLAHPEHDIMRNNIHFYRSMVEIRPSAFKNLEAKKHQELYILGTQAYGAGKWQDVVKYMEEALQQYYQEHKRCLASCEGSAHHATPPDFYVAVADHYADVMSCKADCVRRLGAVTEHDNKEDFLPEFYNYLQFAYYQVGDLTKATECVETFLYMKPGDESMLNNKQYYLTKKGIDSSHFTIRQDARRYKEQKDAEAKQYAKIQQVYAKLRADVIIVDTDNTALQEQDDFMDNSLPGEYINGEFFPDPIYGPKDDDYEKMMGKYEEEGAHIVYEEDELLGEARMAVDGLINHDQCQALMDLSEVGAKTGDGYTHVEGRTSPHTNYEIFAGLTVNAAAELARDGDLSTDQAHLYLNLSERTRKYIQDYHNLQNHLYFHFTHLACRTALQDQDKRKDLSHPVHSDNCHIQADGSCPKLRPAYVHRDFSALLYLNEDFEGGDFFFAHKNRTVQKKVRPKCGRMVAFKSGDYHGVQAVTNGRRCALAIWFTLEGQEEETNHAVAKEMLDQIERRKRTMNNPELQSLVHQENLDIVMTEQELNGPERFVADGTLTKKECQALIDLANEGGLYGDGYKSSAGHNHASPHTTHEMFSGLTVIRAAQLAAEHSISVDSVLLYLGAAEKVRKVVETYFNLRTPLFFDFTHLVCRTALDDTNKDRQDLSHPVHSDNCIIQPDGSCKREPPAYVQRDYSAILYLNEEFEGGNFFFAHTNMSIQSELTPQCGRMVGFNAGNYHGVKAVLSGQRCAVALWFTLNPLYKEEAHEVAFKLLSSIRNKAMGPSVEKPRKGDKEEL